MAKLNGDSLNSLPDEDKKAHAGRGIRGFCNRQEANKIHHIIDGYQPLNYLFGRGIYADLNHGPRPNRIFLDLWM